MNAPPIVTKWTILNFVIYTLVWIGIVNLDSFDTIYFFEPGMVLLLIALALGTGFLIGGLFERWDTLRRKQISTEFRGFK